ncbi:unnamed protein product [Ilex paraguariensis]|uniref:Uncharacterized protein n=1 Tax=Ilex paraguariensis TaxID=185542 RepID=A0ABC8SIX0_9AQUA
MSQVRGSQAEGRQTAVSQAGGSQTAVSQVGGSQAAVSKARGSQDIVKRRSCFEQLHGVASIPATIDPFLSPHFLPLLSYAL